MNLTLILYVLLVFVQSRFGLDQPYNQVGYVQKGVASFYADEFHGRKTANGEKFNMNALTAAHPRIRFNTMLKVTNLSNGKTVVVRVNDRGPYAGGRILDLSKAAALKLDMTKDGTANITAEVIKVEEIPSLEEIEARKEEKSKTGEKEQKKDPVTTDKKTDPKEDKLLARIRQKLGQGTQKVKDRVNGKKDTGKKEAKKDPAEVKTKEKEPVKNPKLEEPVRKKTERTTEKQPENKTATVDESKFAGMNTYSIWGTEKLPEGFGVQVGSFADLKTALEKGKEVNVKGFNDVFIQVGWSNNAKVYRILVGEGAAETAKALIPLLKDKGYSGVFVKQHY